MLRLFGHEYARDVVLLSVLLMVPSILRLVCPGWLLFCLMLCALGVWWKCGHLAWLQHMPNIARAKTFWLLSLASTTCTAWMLTHVGGGWVWFETDDPTRFAKTCVGLLFYLKRDSILLNWLHFDQLAWYRDVSIWTFAVLCLHLVLQEFCLVSDVIAFFKAKRSGGLDTYRRDNGAWKYLLCSVVSSILAMTVYGWGAPLASSVHSTIITIPIVISMGWCVWVLWITAICFPAEMLLIAIRT